MRARYDPLASRIAAHFTLVFPLELAEAPLVAQVGNAVQSAAPIPVVLRRAAVFPDTIGSGYYVFLLAEEGHRELLSLHDQLYEGVLTPHKRPDIPFVPHVTVGAHPQLAECGRIANQLNEQGRSVRAWVHSVDVVAVGESMVRTVAQIPLGFGDNPPPSPTVQRPGARVARPPAADRGC